MRDDQQINETLIGVEKSEGETKRNKKKKKMMRNTKELKDFLMEKDDNEVEVQDKVSL